MQTNPHYDDKNLERLSYEKIIICSIIVLSFMMISRYLFFFVSFNPLRSSTYTRKTSKKMSLKQAQSVEDNLDRKNSKNQSLKMLNPNSLEEVHDKSVLSKAS